MFKKKDLLFGFGVQTALRMHRSCSWACFLVRPGRASPIGHQSGGVSCASRALGFTSASIPIGRTSLQRLVPMCLGNPLAPMVLSPALSLWYSPSPALAVAPLWYSLPLEPLLFALTIFLEFRFKSLPMSRDTRIGGDVYCVESDPRSWRMIVIVSPSR